MVQEDCRKYHVRFRYILLERKALEALLVETVLSEPCREVRPSNMKIMREIHGSNPFKQVYKLLPGLIDRNTVLFLKAALLEVNTHVTSSSGRLAASVLQLQRSIHCRCYLRKSTDESPEVRAQSLSQLNLQEEACPEAPCNPSSSLLALRLNI